MSGNHWALAQAVGHARPYRFQHPLSGAVWNQDAMRDAVRAFVARHLGDGGVLIFDETGDVKRGTATAGRIENAIVAVYAGYATAPGNATPPSPWPPTHCRPWHNRADRPRDPAPTDHNQHSAGTGEPGH